MEKMRFNPFNQIHKGLRALLYHTALQLQHCHFWDPTQADAALEQVKEVITLFEEHAVVEDEQIFPLLQSYTPAIVADFEQQHDTDHQLGTQLHHCINEVKGASSPEARQQAGYALSLAFQDFTAFNLTHMNAEENVVNKALWLHYTDEQLMEKQRAIAAKVNPQLNDRYAFWMLKGLSAPEIVQWFRIVQQTAPAPVWANLKRIAKTALPAAVVFDIEAAISTSRLSIVH